MGDDSHSPASPEHSDDVTNLEIYMDMSRDLWPWAVREAVRLDKFQEIALKYPLPAEVLDEALSEAMTLGRWHVVSYVLVNIDLRPWIVDEAVKQAPREELIRILPFGSDLHREEALDVAVGRGWGDVVIFILGDLGFTLDPSKLSYVVHQAVRQAPQKELMCILPFGTDTHRDDALDAAVERNWWDVVDFILRELGTGLSPSTRSDVVQQAMMKAKKEDLWSILRQDTNQSRETMLDIAVGRGWWAEVSDVLRELDPRLPSSQRPQVVEKALESAPYSALKSILRYCTTEQLEEVLAVANTRGWWDTISFLMVQHLCAKDYVKTYQLDVEDICWPQCDRVIDHDKFTMIVRHCQPRQLTMVLNTAVRRRLNYDVDAVLWRFLNIYSSGDPAVVVRTGQSLPGILLNMTNGRKRVMAWCVKMGVCRCQPIVPSARPKHARREISSDCWPSHDCVFIKGHERNHSCCQAWNVSREAILPESVIPGDLRRELNTFPKTLSDEPLCHAALQNDLDVVRMVTETCPRYDREIHALHREFSRWNEENEMFRETFEHMSAYLADRASNPRSLKSCCRVVISHHLGVGRDRRQKVNQLGLPECLKEYVLFSDLPSKFNPKIVGQCMS